MSNPEFVLWAVIIFMAGCMAGWMAHEAISKNRVTVNPVRNHVGRITGWTVNVGKPVVGYFTDHIQARKHADRIRHAFTGQARLERRGDDRERNGGQQRQAQGGAEGSVPPAD